MRPPVFSELFPKLKSASRSPWAPWAIGALGVLFRIIPYFKLQSLWLDEAFLAFNVLRRDFSALAQPLDYNQSAPVGFLYLVKAMTRVGGNSEYALRFLPLLFSLIALPVFYQIAKKLLPRGAALLAFFLYCFCFPLIRFASEFKQYACDAALTVALLYGYLKWQENRARWTYALGFFALGLAAILVSQPAILILGGLGIARALDIGLRGKAAEKWQCVLVFGVLGGVFASLFLTIYQSNSNNAFLHSYWINGFLPFPPKSMSDIQWFLNYGFSLFRDPLGFELNGLAAFCFFLGLFAFFRGDRKAFALLAMPLVMAILASALGKFPLQGRVAIYLIPIGLLLVAKGVAELRLSLPAKAWPITALLVTLLCIHPTFFALGRAVGSKGFQEYRPVFSRMSSLRAPKEPIYVFCGAVPSYQFYAEQFRLNQGPIYADTNFTPTWRGYDQVIDSLKASPKAWFVFGNIGLDANAIPYFRHRLDQIGQRQETLEAPGVTAFSYRFPQ